MAGKLLMGLMLLVATGCGTPKKVTYFQDLQESVYTTISPELIKIEPNDKLSIVVKSKDPELSSIFNKTLPNDRVNTGFSDYSVDSQGMIDFPLLGELKVAGMTRNELSAYIKGEIVGRGYIKDPVVTVEFVDMYVTVLGEVEGPGRKKLDKDLMTLPEALSLAGDLTIQGMRENVKVLRQTPEGVQTYIVDLTNFEKLSQSPAYYVKQGDVIYVEPNSIKKRETTINGNNVMNVSFWVSVASLLTSVAVLVVK